jgi:hypothetical protein
MEGQVSLKDIVYLALLVLAGASRKADTLHSYRSGSGDPGSHLLSSSPLGTCPEQDSGELAISTLPRGQRPLELRIEVPLLFHLCKCPHRYTGATSTPYSGSLCMTAKSQKCGSALWPKSAYSPSPTSLQPPTPSSSPWKPATHPPSLTHPLPQSWSLSRRALAYPHPHHLHLW